MGLTDDGTEEDQEDPRDTLRELSKRLESYTIASVLFPLGDKIETY